MTRKIPRRAIVAGGVVLAAGGAGMIRAMRSGEDTKTPAASPTPRASATPPPSAGASPTGTTPARTRGTARITSPNGFSIDTFDAQLSGSSALNEVLGRTHSRLLNWDLAHGLSLAGDLATRWEMPDEQTIVFHLDPKARWHDRQPVNGRALVGEDVVAHFQRSLAIAAAGKAPLAQRYSDYAAIQSVDSPEAGQVRFQLKQPDELFLGTLAGEYALIQAPEAVAEFGGNWSKLDSDHVIGTGAWTFDWADDGARFSAFRGGHREPLLDELLVSEPRDGVAGRFIDGSLDEVVVRDRRDSAAVAGSKPPVSPLYGLRDIQRAVALGHSFVSQRDEREIVMSSFQVGSPPWNNVMLVNLISAALNRSILARRLFGGRARSARPVPALDGVGQLSGERLKFLGGYAFLEGDPLEGQAASRQRWEAAGGPGLGTITIDFPSIFDPLYSASSIVVDMLNESLGPQFQPAVETYATISKRVLDGYYGSGRAAFWFGWGPPLPGPDGARYIRDNYAPGSPGQLATGGAGMTGRDQNDVIQLIEGGFGGIVPWVQQQAEVFRSPLQIAPDQSPFWSQHLDYRRAVIA